MVRLTLALCATLALSAPTLAHAQMAANDVATEMHVTTGSLDINTPSGARMMYNKLQAAAYLVCHSDVSDPLTQNVETACIASAVNDAAASLQSPAVMALLSGPKSDAQLLAAASAPTQLAVASDAAVPAGAVADTGNLQPGAARQPGMMSKAWHAVSSAFNGGK